MCKPYNLFGLADSIHTARHHCSPWLEQTCQGGLHSRIKTMLSVRHYFRSQHCMFCPSTTHENHDCVRILSLGIVCGWWWPSVREVSSDPPACLTLSCESCSAGIGVSRFAGCRLVPYSLLPPGSPASLSTPCDIHMCMNFSV